MTTDTKELTIWNAVCSVPRVSLSRIFVPARYNTAIYVPMSYLGFIDNVFSEFELPRETRIGGMSGFFGTFYPPKYTKLCSSESDCFLVFLLLNNKDEVNEL